MADEIELRKAIHERMAQTAPNQDIIEALERQFHFPRDLTILHPPLRIAGVYASLFAQLVATCLEYDISVKVLMEFIWKCGVNEAHKHFSDVLRRKVDS